MLGLEEAELGERFGLRFVPLRARLSKLGILSG